LLIYSIYPRTEHAHRVVTAAFRRRSGVLSSDTVSCNLCPRSSFQNLPSSIPLQGVNYEGAGVQCIRERRCTTLLSEIVWNRNANQLFDIRVVFKSRQFPISPYSPRMRMSSRAHASGKQNIHSARGHISLHPLSQQCSRCRYSVAHNSKPVNIPSLPKPAGRIRFQTWALMHS
jgi:hypothetical protein